MIWLVGLEATGSVTLLQRYSFFLTDKHRNIYLFFVTVSTLRSKRKQFLQVSSRRACGSVGETYKYANG